MLLLGFFLIGLVGATTVDTGFQPVPVDTTRTTRDYQTECNTRTGVWFPRESRCVFFVPTESTFDQSFSECQTRAPVGTIGRLVTVTNNNVANYVVSNSDPNQVYFVNGHTDTPTTNVYDFQWWIGGTDVPQRQVNFVPTGWTWDPTVNPTTGQCIAFRTQDTTGQVQSQVVFFPERCDTPHRFYCEFVVDTTGTVTPYDPSRPWPAPVPPPFPPVYPPVDYKQQFWTECSRLGGFYVPNEYRCVYFVSQEYSWQDGMNQCRTQAPYGTVGRMAWVNSDMVATYFTGRAVSDQMYFVSGHKQGTGFTSADYWWMTDETSPSMPISYMPSGWFWGTGTTTTSGDCVVVMPQGRDGRKWMMPESCMNTHPIFCEFSWTSTTPVPGPAPVPGPYPPQPYPYPYPQPQPYPYPTPQPYPYPQPQPQPQPQPYPYPQPMPMPMPMPYSQFENVCKSQGGYWMATEYRCVYMVRKQYTWPQAMGYCKNMAPYGTDGRLATIDKRYVADFMVSKGSSNMVYFVNGKARGTDHSMMESFWWMRDTTMPDRAINFVPQGQWVWDPTRSTTPGNCLAVMPRNSDSMRWMFTERCTNPHSFFCEFVAFGTVKTPLQQEVRPVDTTVTITKDPSCQDSDPVMCPTWAMYGQCTTNPMFMQTYCQSSCNCCGCTPTKKIEP